MRMTLGHLHRMLGAAERITFLLSKPSLPEFIGELKTLVENPNEAQQLLGYIENLKNTCRGLENCSIVTAE